MNKSKKLIETIYNKTPSDDISSIMGNIGKLLYQFQTSPQKLPKAANVLEKQALGCLKVMNMAQVQLTVTVFTELIKGTREHLSLFEDVIGNVTTVYCESPSLEVRRSGILIFIAYADALDATSAPAARLDFFKYAAQFMKFAKMPAAAANNALKVAAFQGLSACVRAFELRNAMETFIGKLGMDTVSIILENVCSFPLSRKPADPENEADDVTQSKQKKSKKEAESGESNNINNDSNGDDGGSKEISGAATQCLKDLVERVEGTAIASLVDDVLEYFDAKGTWAATSGDYAENCLLTLLRFLKSTNRYLMVVALVQRLERLAAPADTAPEVRARMFTCLERVYSEATGLFPSVLHVAMRHLAASISAGAAGAAGEAEFQRHLIQAVSGVAAKVSLSATKVEGVELVVSRAAEHLEAASEAKAATETAVAFLDLANELLASVKRPFSRRPNDAVVATLLRFAELESAPEVRLGALRLLEIVLSCGQNEAILSGDNSNANNGNNGNEAAAAPISLDDPAVTNGVGVRGTLLRSLALGSNKPQHVAAIASILVVLLYRLRDREIPFLVPFLFEVQAAACSAPRAASLDRARMALVAAGLAAIARLYAAPALAGLAADALAALDAAGLASKELRVDPDRVCPVVQAHSKWRKPYESEGPMTPAFDRAKVVAILAGVKRLARGYVDFSSLLAAEWKAVASGDVAIEMRVGSAKGKPASAKGKAAQKKRGKPQTRGKKGRSSDSESESESESSSESESDSDSDGSVGTGDSESRSHLVSLTKLSSCSVSIASDSIAEMPFTDCDTEEIVFPVVKKSDIVSYKNVLDVFERKKSAADVLGEKKARGAIPDDGDGAADALSFEKIAAACTEYRTATQKTFALVCEDISEDPKDCKTDLLGDEKVADPDLLDPAKNPNVDMDTFVETRQHYPQIFQVTKE